ncbi:MAG: RagB/SusD family nutrient uptake outer membrane protein [Muribaculaceae bacterium]|nr:RagB/SusD family nutrient uptake outer membrane protein [Muribaculaceae bacterium]
MKFNKYIIAGCVALMAFAGTSCVGDLDVTPNDPNQKLELSSVAEWDGFLARLYGNLYRDDVITTSDGGAGTFTRTHFNLQEIVADECFICEKWNDPGYMPLNFCTWSSDNEWIYAAFAREFFIAKMCSEFISQMQDKGAAFFDEAEVKARIAEAHALRGLAYYYMIDVFGRGPWIDENSVTGAIPPTYDRKQLFDAITAELETYVPDLKPAAEQDYGRVSREAGYMLLAKLYLNAEVYTGTAMYKECADACKKVVSTGITLAPEYKYLFCATNDRYVGNGEIIWAVPQQQGRMETWGGTTYLTVGAWIEYAPADVLKSLNKGPDAPWSGLRIRPELSKALKGDKRRMLYEGTFAEEIPDLSGIGKNSCGYMLIKYTNTTEEDYTNQAGLTNNNTAMSNTDYPLFRLADTYLMLAECQLRGVQCNGLEYLNMVRERAGMPAVGALTEDIVLHERQCELYMEGHRRSDLIRFGKYTGGNYLWSWKNGVLEGGVIPEYRALFPIPYQYVNTVGQNPGY